VKRRPLTILDFLPADEIDGRTWTIREHSPLRRQWRFIRRLPGIVQVIVMLFVLAYALIVGFAAWLVTGALTMQL
jgi:hypothetical protein